MSASPAVVPVTIQVERHFDHQPERVFEAYADIDQRTRWIAAPDDAISFESHHFRAGGSDHFVRGPRENPIFLGTTQYEYIVYNERVVSIQKLRAPNDQLLSVSLISWSVVPSGNGALLTITDHTTSVVGSRPIEGAKHRYEGMLDRLTLHLEDGA